MTISILNSKRTRSILFRVSLLLLWQVSHGQTPTTKIDSIMNIHFGENTPGAVVLVSKGEEILYRGAVGLADLELGTKLSPDMIFYIGSNTKQFTAVSILLLVQQGKISLTDNLCKYFPDFSNNCSEITIHHLLNHTSGVYDYTSNGESFIKGVGNNMTEEQMLIRIKQGAINAKPGEVFSYNNSAYYLLGLIIEQVSEISYAEFINRNIFLPVGMIDSHYGDYYSIVKKRVKGYDQTSEIFTNAAYWDHRQVFSAGAIISTADDLLKWRNALNSEKILNKEFLQLAQTNHKLNNGEFSNYGYGFFVGLLEEKKAIYHAGGFSGFNSYIAYFNKTDINIIVLSNCWWATNEVKDVLIDIVKIVTK